MAKMYGYECSGKCPECLHHKECKKESDRRFQKYIEDQRIHSSPTREEFYDEDLYD